MDRFLSNSTNRIDAKGRVSVPAHFRGVLARRNLSDLYVLSALDMPAVNAGGADLLDALESRLPAESLLSPDADDLSLYIHGDGAFMKVDGDGRITVTDFVRDRTGIADQVTFVGRGQFFQMWEPDRFFAYRDAAIARVTKRRSEGLMS